MKKILGLITTFIVTAAIGGIVVSGVPQPAFAADDSCNTGFMGFPAWYDGLIDPDSNSCDIISPAKLDGGISTFIWTIALNIIEIALVATAYVAAFFILYGGFLFIGSNGKPENATKARKTMLDAIIGLIISIAAVAIVRFIANGVIGGSI